MAQLFSNNATATLASAITNIATSITLTTGHGARFNAPTGGDHELLTFTDGVNVEIVKVTARSGDVLTVTRGQEGTAGRAWASSNTTVYAGITKGTLGVFAQNLATGASALALGPTATATQTAATAVGNGADATGTQGTAIGDNASSAAYASSLGSNANAGGSGSVAVGYAATSSGTGSLSLGDSSKASDADSVALGRTSLAGTAPTRQNSHAYAQGDVVNNGSNANTFMCVTAGTTGGSAPTWDIFGGTTTDGSVVWRDFYGAGTQPGSITLGYKAFAVDEGAALGKQAVAAVQSAAMGMKAWAASYSVAMGSYAHAFDQYTIAIGAGATTDGGSSGYGNICIGLYSAVTGGGYSIAIGGDATNRIPGSHVMTGASLLRKDAGEDAASEHLYFAGAEAVYLSKEIDLKSLADDTATITVPAGATFYPDEIGILITAAVSVTGNPNVSFGVTGNTTSLLASTTITSVAAKNRTVFAPLAKHGVNSLTASVKTAATGTTLKGRFYWVGMLVEDQ